MLGAGGRRPLLNASAAVPFSRLGPLSRCNKKGKGGAETNGFWLGWATMNISSLQTIGDDDAANVPR